ncbi:MAG TPA: hypothetical protein PLK37_15855, partial [Terricaulis sp.]|nr:hypothetical protein [Terricaulis sp.]
WLYAGRARRRDRMTHSCKIRCVGAGARRRPGDLKNGDEKLETERRWSDQRKPARLGERFSAPALWIGSTKHLRKFGAETAVRGFKAQRLPFAAPCDLIAGLSDDHHQRFSLVGRLR